MNRNMAKVLAVALIAGTIAWAPPVAAQEPGSSSVRLDRSELEGMRRSNRGQAAANSESQRTQAARNEFVQRMAARGQYFRAQDVDVIEVGATTVVVPKAVSVTQVAVTSDADTAVIDASTVPAETPGIGGGPGSAPYWQQISSGCYTLKFTGAAEMLSCWYKHKLQSDGDAAFDYWGYRRKGWGQPYSISGLDWSITSMTIESTPTAASQGNFVQWEDFEPGADRNGNCDTLPLSLSAEAKGVGLSISFIDCDFYDITFGPAIGKFRNKFSQGAIFSGGNREVAYTTAVKIKPGATPYWSDYSRLEIAKYTYPAKVCEASNANKTCTP